MLRKQLTALQPGTKDDQAGAAPSGIALCHSAAARRASAFGAPPPLI